MNSYQIIYRNSSGTITSYSTGTTYPLPTFTTNTHIPSIMLGGNDS